MAKYIIYPKERLSGSVVCSGSKNAALPAMAAAVLTGETVVLENIPFLSDVDNMEKLLLAIGGTCKRKQNEMCINVAEIKRAELPYDIAARLRASVLLMAPILARCGTARIPIPGGCHIGTRPIDLHLKGLALMGAEISKLHGFVELECRGLHGADIYLDFPSVGATENLILAAVMADGKTVIKNAAAEPEITDLINLLSGMGAKIYSDCCGMVTVEGVPRLHSVRHSVIPDRIEAGTYITMAAVCRGNVEVKNVIPQHISALIAKLSEMGIQLRVSESSVFVADCEGIYNTSIKTLPYPGFPTDLQAPFSALMTSAKGAGMITETIFENRFRHLGELCKMGADIRTDGRCAIIKGSGRLSGAKTEASDLRAGAALVTAALAAEGVSEVDNAEYIERGYENFEGKLRGLGAEVVRV